MFGGKIIKAININQHQSTFNRIPLTLHCHAPCSMSLTHGPLESLGHQLSQPWTRHHPWRMAFSHSNLSDPGKALVKNLKREKYAPKPEVLPSQEQVAVMIWITCVLRPFESFESFELRRDLSQSFSISRRLPKGREVRLIGLGLTNFTMFKTDQNK